MRYFTWTEQVTGQVVQHATIEGKRLSNDDELDWEIQFLEQLCIMKSTKVELECILKNHEDNTSRILPIALKDGGVDIQVYHAGAIDCNQCIPCCEN